MGYMTVMAILNDGWHVMKKNKEELIDRIEDGMNGIERFCGTPHLSKKVITKHGIKNYSSVVIVNRSFHADDENLLYVGMNTMKNMTHADPDMDMEHMIMHMKDIKHAKDLLERSESNMYFRLAESILRDVKGQGGNNKEADDHITKLIKETVEQSGGIVSEKELQNEINRLR